MKKSILFLCMALSLFSVEKLGKMEVITGTRTLKLLSESPVKTEVVTAKDIEISHAKSVDEALRYVPGLMVKETHGKQGSSIWIQGVNSDRVLILLDGEPMVASTGSTVDLSQINVGDISRIEIIKGASSALYGSKAMGGVINIISAEPKHGVHHKVKVEAGSYFNKGSENLGEGFVRTSSSYKDKKSAFTLDFDYRYESGVKLKEGYTEQLPGFTKVNLNSDLRFYGDINFRIIPRIYSEETSKDYTEYVPGGGNQNYEKREDTKKYRLTIEGDTEFENSKLKVTETIEQYYGTSETDNLGSSYIEQKRDADIGFYKREFQYDNTLNESHVITLGGTYVYEDLEQVNTKTSNTKIDRVNELGKSQKREGRELFIQDDWFVFEDLEIIPGLRYQNDSGFGDYTAPKIAAMYSGYFDDGQRVNLRLSYGNGYKVPTLKERYFVFDHSILGYMVIGNPDLKPESSTSFQFSTELTDNDSYSFSVNLYRNDFKDLIEEIRDVALSLEKSLDVYQYANVDESFTEGVEIEFRKEFLDYFTFVSGYTYLNAKNKKTQKFLTNRPKHQLKTSFTTRNRGYEGFIASVYETEQYVDGDNKYTSPSTNKVDIKLTKHFDKSLSVYGGIDNVLDEHKDPDNYTNDLRTKKPRFVYLGTNYKF